MFLTDGRVAANKRKHLFAPPTCCKRRPVSHQGSGFKIIDTGLQEDLVALSPKIEAAYLPCHTSYLDAKGQWNISCYAELVADLPDLMAPGALEHPPLLTVIEPLLERLTVYLQKWWHLIHPDKTSCTLRRVQSFVTKYSAECGKTHLTRHVDGPQVHASMILQLHSPKGFGGGGVTIWDRETREHVCQLRTGELCMLDHCIWHQSNIVTSGERWVLVIFCQEQPEWKDSCSDPGASEGVRLTCQEVISLASRAAEEHYQIHEATALALMRMFCHGDEEERERAAFALGCLASNCSENRSLLVRCGVIQLLTQSLRSFSDGSGGGSLASNERAWVVAALGRLASKDVRNKTLMANEGVIPPVVELLHCGSCLEKEEAISTLCNLAANHEGNKDEIISSGASPPLVQHLLAGSQKQRIWAATALSNLAAGSAWTSGPPSVIIARHCARPPAQAITCDHVSAYTYVYIYIYKTTVLHSVVCECVDI